MRVLTEIPNLSTVRKHNIYDVIVINVKTKNYVLFFCMQHDHLHAFKYKI